MRSRRAPETAEIVPEFSSLVVRVPIAAPVDQVWQRLAIQYGDVHEWSTSIVDSATKVEHASGELGAVRYCELGDSVPIGRGKRFAETILQWDPKRHFFVAAVNDGFYPIRRAVQEFWVEPGPNNGSLVTTQYHFDLSFPMGRGKGLIKRLKPQVVTSLLGLKHLVETGNSQQAQDADFIAKTYPAVYESNGV